MGVRKENSLIFERPKPGRIFMLGSAACAQTQLTPGVSTLAAPRSSIKPGLASVCRFSMSKGRRDDDREAGRRNSETAVGRRGVVRRPVFAGDCSANGSTDRPRRDEFHADLGGETVGHGNTALVGAAAIEQITVTNICKRRELEKWRQIDNKGHIWERP